jgi:PadR family transcriptional regulator PadR
MCNTLCMHTTGSLEEARAQMRRGMLEFCTLLIIGKGKVYASDILSELKDAGLIVVEGTLYPLLSRLKTEGLLEYDWKESSAGPPRKYYALTPAGKDKLTQLRTTWKSLVESINSLIQK